MAYKKSLTMEGMSIPNAINVLCSVSIIGICIYLTNYFFASHFPAGIGGGSGICDISSFFTCSGATLSPVSNILGTPVAFFGLISGLIYLAGVIFPSENMEKTSAFIAYLNIPGIVFFFLYSLIALGTLCPLCTAYYVLSLGVAFLHYKHGANEWKSPSPKILGVWVVITIIGAGFFSSHYSDKLVIKKKLVQDVISQFNTLAKIGDPELQSPYLLAKGAENFKDSKIRLSVFSDFECPYCGIVSKQIHDMIVSDEFQSKYKGKVSIAYYFYPLDQSCNPGIKRKFHEFACKAAMIAGCEADKFIAVHNYIFENQKSLSDEFLKSTVNKFGLKNCFKKSATGTFIGKSVRQGDDLGVASTPTLILNGLKIEGVIPNEQFFAIFDSILAEKK
jgi:protein-disulfide isomerase/uncharacterized membrane protein